MIRLHEQDINTPEWFDKVWHLEKIHRFDVVRMLAFTERMQPGQTICDLGAGMFSFAEFVLTTRNPADITAYALDWSEYAKTETLKRCPELHYEVGNALKAPWSDGMFDFVGSGELIEHLERPQDLVAEMNRLTRKGGRMVISTLNPQCDDALRHGDYPEHLWEFEIGELLSFFAPYGNPQYFLVGDYHVVVTDKRH